MSVCEKKFNQFCYICGKFTIPIFRRNISPKVEDIYRYYFGLSVYKHVKWAPEKACNICCNGLRPCFSDKRQKFAFKMPVIWSDPGEHDPANCNVCCNDVVDLNRKKRKSFVYTGVRSAVLPVPYAGGEKGPKKPSPTLESFLCTAASATVSDDDEIYQPSAVVCTMTFGKAFRFSVETPVNLFTYSVRIERINPFV